MIIYFNSGLQNYILWLGILNFSLSFLSVFFGVTMFFFYTISALGIIMMFYLFRTEEREIFQENSIVAYGDGSIISHQFRSPDVFNIHEEYNCLEIISGVNNIYFKYAPVNGKVVNILEFYGYEKFNIVHSIKIAKTNKYIGFHIEHDQENMFILFEVLHVDKSYAMYKIYKDIGDEVKKGDLIFCSHFYSKSYFFINKKHTLLVHKGQKVLYNQTIICLLS